MPDITSRYYGIPTNTIETPTRRTITYFGRRFIGPPDQFATISQHVVADGERPDLLANQYLGDPEQFWRLCDPNNVLDPEDLTSTPGRLIRITLPEGVPGAPDA